MVYLQCFLIFLPSMSILLPCNIVPELSDCQCVYTIAEPLDAAPPQAEADSARAPAAFVPAGSTSRSSRKLLSSPHRAMRRAVATHAAIRRASLRAAGRGRPAIKLPTIPSSPPVCSTPPPMRFCHNVRYPVYRPSADHTFAQLDFDSHAVYKKIVPHMRISERCAARRPSYRCDAHRAQREPDPSMAVSRIWCRGT
jgi:hypothetical protein